MPATLEIPRRTVLVVDDDPHIGGSVAAVLQRRGWIVRHANSIRQAQDKLAESIPDCILLDLVLPDGPGESVLDAVRHHLDCRVVVVTGILDPDRLAAIEARVPNALLRKPVGLKALMAAMGYGP